MDTAAEMAIDSSFLIKFQPQLNRIFDIYLNDVSVLTLQYETMCGEFPIAVQNEIRAAFTHLARASLADSKDLVERNIQKIESHMKRALLDCHKYICIAVLDQYDDFFNKYDGVDLSYLDNGSFLPSVHQLYQVASDALIEARKLELTNAGEEQLYIAFQDAYDAFSQLHETLLQADIQAEFIKHKATNKELRNNIFGWAGIIGLVITAISFVVQIVR